jgi:hypothetical protein
VWWDYTACILSEEQQIFTAGKELKKIGYNLGEIMATCWHVAPGKSKPIKAMG